MTKHVIDQHKSSGDNGGRTAQYSRIEGEDMPRPQTQELQKRKRTNTEGKRLKEYTDIERRSED